MSLSVYDAPIDPNEFLGRMTAIQTICGRLTSPGLSSTSVVGGPKTGKTSLLRYLASPQADALLPGRPPERRVYLDAQILAAGATSYDFWIELFRQLKTQDPSLAALLQQPMQKADQQKLRVYDLQDLFDACGKAKLPVVVFVDNWEYLLGNANFFPPDNFLHLVRSFGQRLPRGLGLVVASPRPLLDLWDPGRAASPYYNIFETVQIATLSNDDIALFVRAVFKKMALAENSEIETLIQRASVGHPFLVSYVTGLCVERLSAKQTFTAADVQQAFSDPNGPLVGLIRQIRGVLIPSERQLLDLARNPAQKLTESQRLRLQNLAGFGLAGISHSPFYGGGKYRSSPDFFLTHNQPPI